MGNRPQKEFGEYLAERVEYDTNGGCWLWTRAMNPNGYGLAHDPKIGRLRHVHRRSFEHFTGLDAAGLCVLHRCDVPACVNPAHLFLGSHSDNSRDMSRKGRCRQVLSADIVREIRRRLADGERVNALARSLKLAPPHIVQVKNGTLWAWVEDAA